MTSGEELMIFLEMNGYDITKYKIKKQLTCFRTGNISLMHKQTLEDFLLSYYNTKDLDVLLTNPLIYLDLWKNLKRDKDKVDIFDFHITHPRIEEETTLQGFMDDATIKEDIKNRILKEVVKQWVKEYKEYLDATTKNINTWTEVMMKDIEYFRVPTIYKTIGISLVFAVLLITYLSPISSLNFYRQALVDHIWFNVFYIVPFLLSVMYIVRTDLFRKKVKDVKSTWHSKNLKIEQSIDKTLEKFDFEFESLIQNDEIINRRQVQKKLSKINTIKDYLNKLYKQVFSLEKDYNKVLNKYEFRLHFKDVFFYIIISLSVIYLLMGFVLSKGWI